MCRYDGEAAMLKKLADCNDQESLGARMRRKIFRVFLELIEHVPAPVRILDVGGTQRYWEVMGFVDRSDCHITLLNLTQPEVNCDNFTGMAGDATDLSRIGDNEFDIVFSNSVIEHLGDYNRQKLMAEEIQRVGKRYFVQTPNFFFPIEPHFLFPFFHWLPVSARAFLLTKFNLGWRKKEPDLSAARASVESIRLLSKRELLALFPQATLYRERFLGLTKSFVVYNGW